MKLLSSLALCLSLILPATAESAPQPLNILLITADDLNNDSIGAFGCKVPDITPNLDALAEQGMKFQHAHVTIAVCQPSRQAIMTGRYPHNNGAPGFDPIRDDVPTLQESLRKAGYLNGILGKEKHLQPAARYCWDYVSTESDLADGAGIGRSVEAYRENTRKFIEKAKGEGKPFFLMANMHDPHRPLAGSKQELDAWGHDLPKFTRKITGDQVEVPGFLPDIPDVRKEIAEYYTSVYRCDQAVGAVLKVLRETGQEENTLVMFLSDNGMAFPFAKSNCYLQSTKTPWIVRWPGTVKEGVTDSEHPISGIDYMPTVLDALGLDQVAGMNGTSFLPVLKGEKQPEREYVFTGYHRTYARQPFPMRAVQGKRFGYLINFWADRTVPMRMDSTSGLTFNAMRQAAEGSPEIAARVKLFEHRVLEEFFDFEKDPDALHNLIDSPEHQDEIARMRTALAAEMKDTDDPALEAFLGREDPAKLDAFMEAQNARKKR